MDIDMKFMRRAIQLARFGEEGAHPNPMVGAVIVSDDTGLIVGEGWHRHCGEGHAEVNAVAAADARGADFSRVTMYVTLEPCAHYGKTPPCAELIVNRGIRRVVVGSVDPFSKVGGRGIRIMRESGVEVIMAPDNVAAECMALNPVFFTAHTLKRPYVTLKWACSADGFIDRRRTVEEKPTRFSVAATSVLVHRLRALSDAIGVGSVTEVMDRPRLDCRLWPGGRSPRRVKFTRMEPLDEQLKRLYADGITSLLIEGGSKLMGSFIKSGLWDTIRVEIAPFSLGEGVPAPLIPASATLTKCVRIGKNALKTYKNTYKYRKN